jgi:hypothetical protein
VLIANGGGHIVNRPLLAQPREHAADGRLLGVGGGGALADAGAAPVLAAQGISVHGVYPGGIDTHKFAGVDAPKTPPAAVAASLLDGLAHSRRHLPRPERGSDGGSSGG